MDDNKIVFFDIYCHKCKHWDSDELEDPCNECLTYGGNFDSHKPVNYEPSDDETLTKKLKTKKGV